MADEVEVIEGSRNDSRRARNEETEKNDPLIDSGVEGPASSNDDHLSALFQPLPLQLAEVKTLQSRQTLNFSASDIAAICGFHPYKNLAQLVFRLVYHGRIGATLQRMDAQALGLSLEYVTEEEIWKALAAQAGPSTTKALDKALKGKTTQTVQQAQVLKEEVIKKATQSGKLQPRELKVLKEGTRHVVNTRFGTHHEDDALDQAEAKFGWEIFDRNQEIMEWRFAAAGGTVEPMEDAKPCSWGRRATTRQGDFGDNKNANGKRQKRELEGVVDLTEEENEGDTNQKDAADSDSDFKFYMMEIAEDSNLEKKKTSPSEQTLATTGKLKTEEINQTQKNPMEVDNEKQPNCQATTTQKVSKAELHKKHTQSELDNNKTELDATTVKAANESKDGIPEPADELKPNPFFVIRGSVDGRRDELVPSGMAVQDEFDDWVMRPVVVELKHRMNRIFSFPPFYEILQSVTYCLMYQVNDADIVQVIRQEVDDDEKKQEDAAASDIARAEVAQPKKEEPASDKAEANNAISAKNTLPSYFRRKVKKESEASSKDSKPRDLHPQLVKQKDQIEKSPIEGSETSMNRIPNVPKGTGTTEAIVKQKDQIEKSPIEGSETAMNRIPNVPKGTGTTETMVIESLSETASQAPKSDKVGAPVLAKQIKSNAGEETMEMKESLLPSLGISTLKEGGDAAGLEDRSLANVAESTGGSSLVEESMIKEDDAADALEQGEQANKKVDMKDAQADIDPQPEAKTTAPSKGTAPKQGKRGSRRKSKRSLSMQADRISLDDPTYQHGRNWHEVIPPRLYSFASAIYSIRRDDSKRYRLLNACSDPLGSLEGQAWELLFEECEWLKACDTAFRRGGAP